MTYQIKNKCPSDSRHAISDKFSLMTCHKDVSVSDTYWTFENVIHHSVCVQEVHKKMITDCLKYSHIEKLEIKHTSANF